MTSNNLHSEDNTHQIDKKHDVMDVIKGSIRTESNTINAITDNTKNEIKTKPEVALNTNYKIENKQQYKTYDDITTLKYKKNISSKNRLIETSENKNRNNNKFTNNPKSSFNKQSSSNNKYYDNDYEYRVQIKRAFNTIIDLNTLQSYLVLNPLINNNGSKVLCNPEGELHHLYPFGKEIKVSIISNNRNPECLELAHGISWKSNTDKFEETLQEKKHYESDDDEIENENTDNMEEETESDSYSSSPTPTPSPPPQLIPFEKSICSISIPSESELKPYEEAIHSIQSPLPPSSPSINNSTISPNSLNSLQSSISSQSPPTMITMNNQCLPETVQNNTPSLLPSLLPQLDIVYHNEKQDKNKKFIIDISSDESESEYSSDYSSSSNDSNNSLFLCKFVECNNWSSINKSDFNKHNLYLHDVGLEFRFIALAARALTKPFPQIGLQCPYVNCDENLFFNSTDLVINHLQNEHNEDLKELMQSKGAKQRNITNSFDAAKYCMVLGKVPLIFDDKVIYCCPFTKNNICTTKCFVEDPKGLINHLQSFHALNKKDAQFIINILRFVELKPIWRHWSKQKMRNKIHDRLNALLKYRGNVRKGFIKDYNNKYTRKYLKKNSKKKLRNNILTTPYQSQSIDNEFNGIIENKDVSILSDNQLFWQFVNCDNIGIDQDIFENIVEREINKKTGRKMDELDKIDNNNNNNNNKHKIKKKKRGRKRQRKDTNSSQQSKRRKVHHI